MRNNGFTLFLMFTILPQSEASEGHLSQDLQLAWVTAAPFGKQPAQARFSVDAWQRSWLREGME